MPIIIGSVIGAVSAVAVIASVYYLLVYRPKRRLPPSVSSFRDLSVQQPEYEPGCITSFFSRYSRNANTRPLRPFPLDLEKSSPSPYPLGAQIPRYPRTVIETSAKSTAPRLLPAVTTPETGGSGVGGYFSSLTRPQVDLESRIRAIEAELQNLNGRMTPDVGVAGLQHQIQLLTGLQESNWALGLTYEMPPEYIELVNPFNDITRPRDADTHN